MQLAMVTGSPILGEFYGTHLAIRWKEPKLPNFGESIPEAVRHPFFACTSAASFLGNALGLSCDSDGTLVVPKALAVELFACNLAEEYLRTLHEAIVKLKDDISVRYEQTPDARSLAEFRHFALEHRASVEERSRSNLPTLCRLSNCGGAVPITCRIPYEFSWRRP